jgi:hypothetical protein
VRLKFGFEQAKAAQGYENLASIARAALGGGKGTTDGGQAKGRPVQSMSEARAIFSNMFGAPSVG